jgi:hypothetical protein
MRRALAIALVLCLAACEAGEIAVFSAAAAGTSGVAGVSGAAVAGAGTGGTSGSANSAGFASGMGGGGTAGGGVSGGGGASAGSDAGGSGGSGGTTDTPCHDNADCPSTYFCSTHTCSDTHGVCLPRPFPDDTSAEHVCGCDHITYWNDSLRQRYGICASTLGPCDSGALTCAHDQDCVPDASCSHLLPPNVMCGAPPGTGQCWITPSDCSSTDSKQYQICPPPGSPAGSTQPCVTKCQAIQSGHPFMPVPHGVTCP